jgi:cytochrome c553
MVLALAGRVAARADEPPTFVGAQACAGCHTAEFNAWNGSRHALAMQPANAATVLGDFASARFEHFGVTTIFLRDSEKFVVRTDGPDGALHEYPVAHTFGVYPLQQYLIAMPGGRLQALGIAWDSRPKDQGGQRRFHLYPDQQLPAADRLHWTGRDQTWNYQCADCHSTDLKKNYDLAANTYTTSCPIIRISGTLAGCCRWPPCSFSSCGPSGARGSRRKLITGSPSSSFAPRPPILPICAPMT